MLHSFEKNKVAMFLVALLLSTCLMMGLFSAGVSASQSDQERISIAASEPVYVYWSSTATDTGVVTKVDSGSTYYPASFFLYVDSTYAPTINNGGTIAAMPAYDTDFGKAYKVTLPSGSASTITTHLNTYDDYSGYYYLTCSAPAGSPATGSGLPAAVPGYLTIGQYAASNAWGTICTDNTNTGTTKKFLSGYTATGASLGVLGGYVQFDFRSTPIANDTKSPYGIDFIVYGNAFNGNPEAGCVKVSNDGATWYTLAGSLHYDSDTTWNNTVSYINIAADNTIIGGQTFATAGLYSSFNYVPTSSTTAATVNTAIGAADWTLFRANSTPWWPLYGSTRYYGNVYGNVNGVTWNRSGATEVISMAGTTRVKDDAEKGLTGTAATDYYGYGYADVRANGSNYGTAVNPYANKPSASNGGDGFDLAWAVDANGNPAPLSSVRHVRVYTGVLYNAGALGETSTEVTGLYVTNKATADVGTTTAPTAMSFTAGAYTTAVSDTAAEVTIPSGNTATTFTLTATDSAIDNFWMNNSKTTSGTAVTFDVPAAGADKYVRIVAQDESKQPYILLVKVHKNV